MIKLLDFIACTSVALTELIIILLALIIVQAIFYRVFNVNLYKIIKDKLKELERRIEKTCLEN